jgi:hypothetical protein
MTLVLVWFQDLPASSLGWDWSAVAGSMIIETGPASPISSGVSDMRGGLHDQGAGLTLMSIVVEIPFNLLHF